MGPASHPASILSLLFASLLTKVGSWAGPHLPGCSDTAITTDAVVTRHASPLALEEMYFVWGSRLHVRFEIDSRAAQPASFVADVDALGICAGIQHDVSGFSATFDPSRLLSSLAYAWLQFPVRFQM
jgi:hypothetical protein